MQKSPHYDCVTCVTPDSHRPAEIVIRRSIRGKQFGTLVDDRRINRDGIDGRLVIDLQCQSIVERYNLGIQFMAHRIPDDQAAIAKNGPAFSILELNPLSLRKPLGSQRTVEAEFKPQGCVVRMFRPVCQCESLLYTLAIVDIPLHHIATAVFHTIAVGDGLNRLHIDRVALIAIGPQGHPPLPVLIFSASGYDPHTFRRECHPQLVPSIGGFKYSAIPCGRSPLANLIGCPLNCLLNVMPFLSG